MKNKISGIYKITNLVTGDFYIGSSKNIKRRWATHKCSSTWISRPGVKLYQAFIEYDLNNFSFEIIEETDNLREREQYWIDQLNPSYNINKANGRDLERYNETYNEWYKSHREEMVAKCKEWKDTHREEFRNVHKKCNNRLCLYEDEILTINALSNRFHNQGIPHAWLEAKKYLLDK